MIVGEGMWACQAMQVKRQKLRIAQLYANEQRISRATRVEELRWLMSRNLHSDILAGNQESARVAVALVSTVVEQ